MKLIFITSFEKRTDRSAPFRWVEVTISIMSSCKQYPQSGQLCTQMPITKVPSCSLDSISCADCTTLAHPECNIVLISSGQLALISSGYQVLISIVLVIIKKTDLNSLQLWTLLSNNDMFNSTYSIVMNFKEVRQFQVGCQTGAHKCHLAALMSCWL